LGEDLPQLAIQTTALDSLPRHALLIKMSLALSALSIVFGLFRRSWSCFIFCLRTRDVPKSQLQRLTAPDYDMALQDHRKNSNDRTNDQHDELRMSSTPHDDDTSSPNHTRSSLPTATSDDTHDQHDYSERKGNATTSTSTSSMSSTNEQRSRVQPVVTRDTTFASTTNGEPEGAAEFADIRIA
jgi:hypothetical protein